jgi:hypothetical protein
VSANTIQLLCNNQRMIELDPNDPQELAFAIYKSGAHVRAVTF